jgi:RNA polymerase sigma-70 factor (ECF subfamily)
VGAADAVGEEGKPGLSCESTSEVADDRVLLGRVGAGDERALAELYARYSAVVFSFVLARVTDRGLAEEISADAWLGCWRSARAFRGDSQVLTWLLGIAKRQVWAHTRRMRLATVALDERAESMPADDPDPAEVVSDQASVDEVRAAMSDLPDDLAEVVRLAWLYELPYGEIASVVGIPVGTVKSRVSRARRLMGERLRRNDG